eukprot:366119-Chlamydomonas_euryale.AAC.33
MRARPLATVAALLLPSHRRFAATRSELLPCGATACTGTMCTLYKPESTCQLPSKSTKPAPVFAHLPIAMVWRSHTNGLPSTAVLEMGSSSGCVMKLPRSAAVSRSLQAPVGRFLSAKLCLNTSAMWSSTSSPTLTCSSAVCAVDPGHCMLCQRAAVRPKYVRIEE